MRKRLNKPRNFGTISEAAYWGKVRSALRNAFRYWRPGIAALKAAERPNQSANARLRYEYQCGECQEWQPRKQVQIDHIVPCGSLRSGADLEGFLKRLTPESPEAYMVLCKICHQQKTTHERDARTKDNTR